MCGIVGIIAKFKNGFFLSHVEIFEQLLYADNLRGNQGTGIFYNNGKKVHSLKCPVPSYKFLEDKKVKEAMTTISQVCHFVVGHNRAATKGALTAENTHPHLSGHIMLVHNGTLLNHKQLKNVESDSLAITISMEEIGAEETIKKLDGAYALVWNNSQDNTINLVRNIQRPLFLIETHSCYVIASELKLAEWICDRNKLHITSSKSIPTGEIMTYSLDDMSFTSKKVEEFKPAWGRGKKNNYYGTDYDYYPASDPVVPPSGRYQPPLALVDFEKAKNLANLDKVSDVITFVPFQVLQGQDKSFYLHGEVDSLPGTISPEIKYYSNDKKYLDKLCQLDELQGVIKAIRYNDDRKCYIVRDVKEIKDITPTKQLVSVVH